MYRLFKRIKHLLIANNQHGIHSPFVYDYITKCLYSKSDFNGNNTEKVLLKSVHYFKYEKINVSEKNVITEIEQKFNLNIAKQAPYDLIYLAEPNIKTYTAHKEKVHNNSLILIGNIHKNQHSTLIWKTLIKDKKVIVSIDLFYCGVLFFRKEQVKEHFKIRI